MNTFPDHYIALLTDEELYELQYIEERFEEVRARRERLLTRLRVRAHRARKKEVSDAA